MCLFINANNLNSKYFITKNKCYKVNLSILIYGMFFIFLTLYSGLRSKYIGNDTSTYLELFQEVSYYGVSDDLKERYEILYLYLNRIISYFSIENYVLLLVISFIVLSGYYRFIIKHSSSICLSIFIFFFLRFFDDSMNVLRQSLALVILLLSYQYILRDKFIKFLCLVGLAALFHKTALVFIIAYFVRYLNFTRKNIVFVIIGGVTISIFSGILIDYFMSSYYSYYQNSDYMGDTRLASVLFMLFNICFLFLCYLMLKNKQVSEDIKNQFYFVLIGSVMLLISLKFNLLDRVAAYFNVFMIVLIPNSIKKIRGYNKKIFSAVVVLTIMIIYYYTIIYFKPDWNDVYPYKIFLYD